MPGQNLWAHAPACLLKVLSKSIRWFLSYNLLEAYDFFAYWNGSHVFRVFHDLQNRLNIKYINSKNKNEIYNLYTNKFKTNNVLSEDNFFFFIGYTKKWVPAKILFLIFSLIKSVASRSGISKYFDKFAYIFQKLVMVFQQFGDELLKNLYQRTNQYCKCCSRISVKIGNLSKYVFFSLHPIFLKDLQIFG